MRKGLPDPWPLAKVTINMDSPSQWVSKMGRLFFADEYVRHAVGTYTTKQLPQLQTALKAVQDVLTDLETRVVEFLLEWLVALLMPAKHVLETRSPHLSFMLLKEHWFRELYLGLKVAASFDRNESFIKTIDGQIRCITAGFIFFLSEPVAFRRVYGLESYSRTSGESNHHRKSVSDRVPPYQLHHEDDYITAEFKPKGANVAWNVNYINVFIPAWMVPPMYHSLRREYIRVTDSKSAMGVKSLAPHGSKMKWLPKPPRMAHPTPLNPLRGEALRPPPCTPPSAFFNSLYLTRKNPKKSFIFGGQKIKQINAALRV